MRQIDDFTALPLHALADAALRPRPRPRRRACRLPARARPRSRPLVCATRASRARNDADDLGFAVRVVHDGTWGFAAGVDLDARGGGAVAEQAVEVAEVSAAVNREPVELAPEPVHADVDLGLLLRRSTRSTCRARQDRRCSPTGARGLLADRASTTSTPRLTQVKEQKFYADPAGTSHDPAAGPRRTRAGRPSGSTRRRPLRDDAHRSRRRSAGAGST